MAFVEHAEALEAVPCVDRPVGDEVSELVDLHQGCIVIDAIHSGDVIPAEFRETIERTGCEQEIEERYPREKDWGADHLAHALATKLGLEQSYRVSIARAILDFGRFPGNSRHGATHAHRFAINSPFSYVLTHHEKRRLLEIYYDGISDAIEEAVRGKHIKISIHTYDRFNPLPGGAAGGYPLLIDGRRVGTERPELSLVFGSHGYHNETEMPYGVFDELFPDELGELTADRKLTARILLEVANAGYSVTHNHPYLLPEGSVEVRSQVWFFFEYLRERFERDHPESRGVVGFDPVWEMLFDTNLRRSDSEVLRSYLHGFRRAPHGMEKECEQAEAAYAAIRAYVDENRESIIDEYHHGSHTERPSSLVVEVRKDVLWRFVDERKMFNPVQGPDGLIHRNVERLSDLLRDAILTYLRADR